MRIAAAVIFFTGAAAAGVCVALGAYGTGHLAMSVGIPRSVFVILLGLLAGWSIWWHAAGKMLFPGDRSGIQANKAVARAGWIGKLYFGFVLGLGFLTRIATPLWYAIPLACASIALAPAIALGAGAGLGRSWPVARAVTDFRVPDDRVVRRGLDLATPHHGSDTLRAVAAGLLLAAAVLPAFL